MNATSFRIPLRAALLLAAAALAAPPAARAQAPQDAPPAAQQPSHWFVPGQRAPSSPSTVDTSAGKAGAENVVVVGRHPSRSWRSQPPPPLRNPLVGNAAHPMENEKPYCNSTLRTVGGQPASAADMVTGVGSGGC